MSKETEVLRKKLEDLEAFETSAEIGLNLLAALEALEAKAQEWEASPDSHPLSPRGTGLIVKHIIWEALEA